MYVVLIVVIGKLQSHAVDVFCMATNKNRFTLCRLTDNVLMFADVIYVLAHPLTHNKGGYESI